MPKALVVLSGGQDSTIALFLAKKQVYDEIHAITFDYGQRHRREIDAARKIAVEIARVKTHEIININNGILRSVSPLVDHSQELEQYENHEQMGQIIGDRVELTFVPMRNALFLTIAANRAIALDAEDDWDIWVGVCQEDNANYPDCREDFIDAQQDAINEALGDLGGITLYTPVLHYTKDEALRAYVAHSPDIYYALAYSHTAYDGTYPPSGADHATVLRAYSFEKARMPDPLIVRAWLDGLISDLPETANYTRFVNLLESLKGMAENNFPIDTLLKNLADKVAEQ